MLAQDQTFMPLRTWIGMCTMAWATAWQVPTLIDHQVACHQGKRHVDPRQCGHAGKTHRQLFSEFYQDLMHESLESLLAQGARPPAGVTLFHQMMRDIMSGGQQSDVTAQACLSSLLAVSPMSKKHLNRNCL